MASAIATQPAIAPGIYFDMPAAEYHAAPGLSNSGMKKLAVSPLRYWYHEINPAPKVEEEETVALRIGSALHCAVLEKDEEFERRYACEMDPSDWPVCLDTVPELRGWITDNGEKPKGTRKDEVIVQALGMMARLNKHVPIVQEEKRRFLAANEGKTILHKDEFERVSFMALALREEPAVQSILSEGRPEVSIFATDPETGVLLKSRLDWMHPRITFDLKSLTVKKRGESFDKAVHNAIYYEAYHRQAYLYDYVRRLATGEDHGHADFVFAFVESDLPNETRIKRLQPKRGGSLNLFWEIARQETQAMIRLYAECLDKFGADPWRTEQQISTLADEDIRQFAY